MPSSDQVQRLLPLVREYGRLERKRTKEGVTPQEFERWSKLKHEIGRAIPQGDRPEGGNRREHIRLPTRMLVDFRDKGELQNALIRNISRGGLYIATPHAPEVGTKLDLVIQVGGGTGSIEMPVEVVSTHLPDAKKRTQAGIGCKFGTLNATQQAVIDDLFEVALDAGSAD